VRVIGRVVDLQRLLREQRIFIFEYGVDLAFVSKEEVSLFNEVFWAQVDQSLFNLLVCLLFDR
jgi:hypothetical protein